MNVVVFEGALGTGKTNGAVVFANYLKACSPKISLYSNFGMKDSKPFTSLYDFLDIADNFSSVVVLDESHVDLDSRDFSTNHVKFFSKTSFYLRKARCTLIMTSPLYENLDTRIRGITNMLCVVRKDKKYFYYDMYDVQSDKFLKTKKIRQQVAFDLNLYDTNAIVTPVEVPESKEKFNEFLVELKNKTETYYKSKQIEVQA